MTLQYELEDFLRGDRRSRWLVAFEGKIYVRRERRHIEGALIELININNIDITRMCRGGGVFTKFLDYLEDHPKVHCVMIEHVLETRLIPFLLNRGYTEFESVNGAVPVSSFYWIKGVGGRGRVGAAALRTTP